MTRTARRAMAPQALMATALLCAAAAQGATLKIACTGLGKELELCREAAGAWARKSGHQVEVVTTPNDASERLALYQQVLSSGSDKIDVFQVEINQVGLLGNHLLDLRAYSKGVEKGHFESMLANSTVGGKLVAMPWFIDAGLLYYRRDLLEKYKQEVPQTWEQLKATAQLVQDAERKAGKDKMWGYVWQGRAYEGLTCNALEWVASHGGGTIVDDKGKVTIGNPNTVKALTTIAGFVGTISPTAVLNYAEEEARGPFQNGNAVFMRNWPYAWAATQAPDSPVKDKVGVAVLPRGSGDGARHAATLGGQALSVSRHSKNAALAADLVLYMTSAEVQKDRAIKGSYNPSIQELYKDPDIRKANPFMGSLLRTFTSAVARPTAVTGSRYNQVSSEFQNAVHEVLSKTAKPEEAVARLNTRLNQLSRGGRW